MTGFSKKVSKALMGVPPQKVLSGSGKKNFDCIK